MPRRTFSSYFRNVFDDFSRWLAEVRAYLTRIETGIAKRGFIMSDVFGADVFIQPVSLPPSVPHPMPSGDDPAHWDAALDFEPAPVTGRDDFPRFLASAQSASRDVNAKSSRESEAIAANAASSEHNPEQVLPPPLFLYRSNADRANDAALVTRSAFRIRWQMFAIAAILLVVWIGSGQSDPLAGADALAQRTPPQMRNPAADALADTFAGTPSRSLAMDRGDAETDHARLHFAPRFSVLYAEVISTTGSVEGQPSNAEVINSVSDDELDDDAPSLSRDAALVLIRNLPDGTTLSAGTRVSPTDWALTPSDLKSIVVTLPDNRRTPVRANIEVFGMSGASAGTVAVEIRERDGGPLQASTSRRAKVYRSGSGKSASSKRRTKPSSASQLAANDNAAKTAMANAAPANAMPASALPASPATQQLLPQLPFLPGPHSPTPPPGTTVGQQILINLGVTPSAAIVGLTEKN